MRTPTRSSMPGAPRVTTTHDGAALIIRVEAAAPMLAPDGLVVFPFGLEKSAARALVAKGTLRTAKIGRLRYAKRSDIVALVDKLAAIPAAKGDVQADYTALVKSARARR